MMLSKVQTRTLLLLVAWLVLQNFNLAKTNVIPSVPSANAGKGSSIIEVAIALTDSVLKTSAPAYRIRKIVLDAGHGGKDPGCVGTSGNYEKHNALAIVLKLGAIIKTNYPDVEVIYTREEDVFVELNERAAIANRNKADLFISVHCNSLSVSSTKGTETYVLGLHKAQHNLEVAKRENASIYLEKDYQKNYEGYDPNSPEAHILGSVWQSAYLEQSILLASLVQEHAHESASREDRGVKQAGFLVLKETAMPAILVESGYMTNSKEDAYLASEEGRDEMAWAIFRAFQDYKDQMEGHKKVMPQPAKSPKKTPVAKPKQEKTTENVVARQTPPPAPAVKSPQTTEPVQKSCRIHLMSWSKKLDVNTGQLALLSGIKEEKIGDEYRYFTSPYATCAEAERMLPEIKNLGFKNAVVVSSR